MPNWCHNSLLVQGKAVDIAVFTEEATIDGKLRFAAVLPLPKGFEETREGEDYREVIDWQSANWGTKWDLEDTELTVVAEGTKATAKFETAWSPPQEWFAFVVRKYPRLRFELAYQEGGMDFSGLWVADDGRFQKNLKGRSYESYNLHGDDWAALSPAA
mmetsp:Transcript_2497/g.8387  ORF Transcript_2497/g.8387 Transcript_2497/m.8387 type:complete len:159 (-) Transcript_2497:32-508(-)